MLVRFSKYDFWIPGEILDLYRTNSVKKKAKTKQDNTMSCRKYCSRLKKKSKKILLKNSMKNENFAFEFGRKNTNFFL